MKEEIKRKVISYIKDNVRREAEETSDSWHRYSSHKRKIDDICMGNNALYSWAIDNLTEAMGI